MRWVRAALLLVPALFIPGLIEGFELPKAAVLRVCGLAAGVAALGFARGRWRRLRTPLDLAVLAWLVVEAATTVASRAPWMSLAGDYAQHEGLVTSLALAGGYLAVRVANPGPEAMRVTLRWWLAGMGIAAAYALVQAFGLDPLDWHGGATYGPGMTRLRPFGTLGHPTMLAPLTAAAAVSAPFLLPGPGRRRWLIALATLGFSAVTALTLARGAWVGAVAALAVALPLAWWADPERRLSRRTVWTLAAALVVLAAAAAGFGARSEWGRMIAARLGEIVSPASASSRARIEIWKAALAMARDRLWIGQGPDTFCLRFPAFQTPEYWRIEWGSVPFHAHSIVLHALATRGIAGVVAGGLWVAALGAAALAAWRGGGARRAALPGLLGMLVTLGVAGAFGALGIAGALTIVTASALLASLAWPAPPAPARAAAPRRARRGGADSGGTIGRGVQVAARLVAIVALTAGAVEVAAERATTRATNALMAAHGSGVTLGDPRGLPAAVRDAARAAALFPGRDSYALCDAQCLLAYSRAGGAPPGALADAERVARRALALVPLRAANWVTLAVALSDAGARAEADAAWARVRALAPYDGEALSRNADAAFAAGRRDEALRLARRAVELYPQDGPLLFALSGAEGAAGDSLAALATLRRAADADWHGNDTAHEAVREVLAHALAGGGEP